ncbi:hypothetical protein CR956_00665 [Candidatus Saccharibacteria bacterium]|nr:MAG: hypothetical protein CR956_00665 [Candidatus Saccharibacteria bacterium]
MNRFGKIFIAAVASVLLSTSILVSVHATSVAPSEPPKTSGPFIVTAYSFSGSSLRYVQIANNSSQVASLDGWVVSSQVGASSWQTAAMSGLVPPHHKVTVADSSVLPDATFTYPSQPATDDLLEEVSLLPPSGSNYSKSTVKISVKKSTPRDDSTTPSSFFFERNISTSTGRYLTSFSATASAPDTIDSDPLYVLNPKTDLRVVEIYPAPKQCSPADDGPLCYDYVKLFNPSSAPIETDWLRLRVGYVGQAATPTNTAELSGVIPANSYASFKINLPDSGSSVWLEDVYGLKVYTSTSVTYPSSSSHQHQSWAYNPTTSKWQWTSTPMPGNQPNQFVSASVNDCKGLRLSEIAANYHSQFIEVYNPTGGTIDISGCQLQTNRSSTKSYVFSKNSKLTPGQYLVVDIGKTELSLTKTTKGVVYLLSSDGLDEIDSQSYQNLAADTSWSLIGSRWQQTFAVTPGSANQYKQFADCKPGYQRDRLTGRCSKISAIVTKPSRKVCPPGYFRNPATNRCKKISTKSSSLKPCPAGYERNPLTKRCRKKVSLATSKLKACPPGYFRNPATNRCKKIKTTTKSLKPCPAGYERNPATNRCRKIRKLAGKSAKLDFPVEETQQTSAGFTAWWALGGALVFGVAYAGWEWRKEISDKLKRIKTIGKVGK